MKNKQERGVGETNQIPTLRQVRQYVAERAYLCDPESFFLKYQKTGWMINGDPIRDWRSLLDGWERKEQELRHRDPTAARPSYYERLEQAIYEDEHDTTPQHERQAIIDGINRMLDVMEKQKQEYREALKRKGAV